jgi:hypothetical protein
METEAWGFCLKTRQDKALVVLTDCVLFEHQRLSGKEKTGSYVINGNKS